jgi:hypothetical protein
MEASIHFEIKVSKRIKRRNPGAVSWTEGRNRLAFKNSL